MKRTASFFMIIAVMAMLLLPNFKSYGFSNEIPPQERLGQKLSNSLFDAKIEMYDNTTGTTDGKTMGDITKIFDGDYGSAWFQTSPTSLGYENWRPYFQLTFKNNKRYVITAIEIYGATDSKNFPRELMFDSNADGSKFSQQIKNITPPSAWKSYIFDINSDNSTNSFGMQMVGDITENGNNFYSLTITEMAVYGYEVKGTVLTQEILSPQFVNPANMQAVSFASGGMGILFDGSKNTVNAVLSSSSAMLKTAFAKNYIITEVRLYGGASSSGFPSSLQIMNSDNGSSFTAVYQSKNIAYQNGAAAIYILPQEITVKYLGIALSGSGNLSLSEIELFGYEKSEPSSTSRKLTASELELTTYFERAVKPNNIFTYSNAANLFNGNFVEQIMTPGVDKNDTAYNKPTINIKFKNNKKFIITKIVPYASWELGQFPDTFNISNNINEVYTPFMSAVLDRASFSWNGVSEAHEINFNNFPVSNGFVIEMRKTGNVTAYAPFTLAELEIYGYEVTDGGENPVSNDSQILNTEFTAKAVFRDYGNLSYGITIGTTEITHVSTPISNLFNNNPVADMWMQFTPITSGYEYLKPLIIMDFNGADRYVITKVEIFGRGDKVNWPSSIKVAVSETSEVFQNIFSAQNVAAPAPGQPYTIQLGTNTSYGGSMVGVEISGNAMNDISELKIYGHKDDYEVLNNIKAPVSLKSYPSMSSLSGTNLDKLHDGLYMGQMFMTSPRNLNDNSYTMLKFDFADGKKYKIDQVRLIPRGDSFEGLPTDIVILTSENGTDYTEVSSKTGIAVPSLGRAIQYKLNTPLETAYFAVAVRGGKTSDQQYLIDMLSEIEVIGKQGSIVIVEDGDEVIDDTGLQLIDPSKFDVSVVFRSDNSNQASGKEGNLFDGNIQTEWYPKTPVSPGYEYLKPMIKITFKNNAFYRIDKIRLFGKADPKNQQFPKSIAIASSKDGITYSNKLFKSGINMITRDSISFAAENLKTSYLAIEVSEGYMVNTNISLPILNEIKIFGEEIEYIDDNNLNRPDQEENLDSIFKNEANQNLIMKSEDFLEILP